MIHKFGENQNHFTFTLILLIMIVLCSKFPWTKVINHKCFDTQSLHLLARLGRSARGEGVREPPQRRGLPVAHLLLDRHRQHQPVCLTPPARGEEGAGGAFWAIRGANAFGRPRTDAWLAGLMAQTRRRWRSNQSGTCSQERLARGTVTSTMRRAAHPSGRARCGAGAGCSAIKMPISRPDDGSITSSTRCGLGTELRVPEERRSSPQGPSDTCLDLVWHVGFVVRGSGFLGFRIQGG